MASWVPLPGRPVHGRERRLGAGRARRVWAADGKACTRTADPGKSVARLWDEALLDAIRRDFPAPTVHARNLYHVSAAMWDAWAAYDPDADGVFVTEKARPSTIPRRRVTGPSATPPTGCSATATRTPPAAGRACASSTSSWPRSATRWSAPPRKGDSPAALGQPHRQAHHPGAASRTARASGRATYSRRLPARQRAAHRASCPGARDGGPQSLAAAGPGGLLHPERPAPAGRPPGVRRPSLGQRHLLRAAAGQRGGAAHRPGPAAAAGRSGDRRRLQGQRRGGHPLQQPARSPRRRDARTSPRQRWATTRWAPTTAPATTSTRSPGSPTRPTSCRAPTSAACSPSSGPTARTPRPRPATGTRWPTPSPTRPASSGASAASARSSIRSNGTSRCTSRSTAPSTTRPSPPGAARATTTTSGPSR